MSGQPEPTTISKVRQALVREADIEDRLRELAEMTNRIKQECQSLSDERSVLRKERWEMMSRMDLTSSGNYGYERRTDVFLMELVKPIVPQTPTT